MGLPQFNLAFTLDQDFTAPPDTPWPGTIPVVTAANTLPAGVPVGQVREEQGPCVYVIKSASGDGSDPYRICVRGDVRLNISICNPASKDAHGHAPSPIFPVGLAVKPKRHHRHHPHSNRLNTVFPHFEIADPASTVLQLGDDDVQVQRKPTSYDFVVVFQDLHGRIGILDPMITNES